MPTLTRKIQIIPDGDFNETYKILNDWRYHSFRLANVIMSERYSIAKQTQSTIQKDESLKWGDVESSIMVDRAKDFLGKVTQKTIGSSFGYCLSKDPDFSEVLPGAIRTKIDKRISGHYKDDLKKGLLKGNVSLRSYRREKMEIYLPSGQKASSFEIIGKDIYFKTINKLKFKEVLGRDKSNNKDAIEKLTSGEYKMPDPSIKFDNGKLFVLLPITVPTKIRNLDATISVGVDLGISVPAVCALSAGYNRAFIGSGKEIINYRFKMRSRRKELQRSIKLSNGGKGRAKKLKAVDRLKSVECNWIQTKNHQISKKIIDFALTNNAGCIKLELLEGFTEEHSKNIVLKNWTYFQLGSMIEYKAKMEGITVVRIDPFHTSQTCSVCGNYEKGQRIKQSVFECKNEVCPSNKGDQKNYVMNADHNAAVNIAKSDKIVTKKEECQYNILKRMK